MKKYIVLIFSVLMSVFSFSQNAKFSVDTKLSDTDVILSLVVENTSAIDSFGLGTSNFLVKLSDKYADLDQLTLLKEGRWSANSQPSFFQNIEIGKVVGDTAIYIKVKPINSQLLGGNFPGTNTYLYPSQIDTIAKVKIQLKSCFNSFNTGLNNLSSINKWDISAPNGGLISNITFQNAYTTSYTFISKTFSSKTSVQTCETSDYVALNSNSWATQKEWFNNSDISMGFGDSKTLTTSGTFKTKLTNSSQTGCTILDSIVYTKILLPNPTLVKDSTICKDATMDVFATSIGDSIFVTSNVSGFGNIKTKDQVSFTVGNAAIGKYFFRFKNSECTLLDTVKVTRSTLKADARIVSGTIKQDTSCFAKPVGLSSSLTTGGSLPYQYTWIKSNSSDVFSDSSAFKTDVIAANSGLNKFYVEVKDANNCVSIDSIEVFQNGGITVNMVDPADTVMLCVSPTAFTDYSVTPTGGSPFSTGTPYKYSWKIQNSNLLILGTGTDTTSKTRMITQNKEGNTYLYTTVTDALGCKAKDSVFLRLRYYSSDIKKQYDPICPDLNDTLTVTVNGGSGNYDVTWFSSDIFFIDKNRAVFKQTATGIYEIDVLVTDNGNGNGYVGCIARTKVPLEVKQLNPQFIDFEGFTKNLNYVCFNDQLYLDASVSTGLYGNLNYLWRSTINNGETFVGPADTLNKIVKMVGGTPSTTSELFLQITDSIGCKASTRTNIFWNTDVLVSGVQDTVFVCDGGQGNLKLTNPSGGTGNSYTYKWNITNSGSTNASFVSSNTSQKVTIKLDLNTPYDTVYVTGTAIDAVGCSKSHDFVMIGTKLQLETSVLDSIQCANIENLLTVTLLSPGNEFGAYQFNWRESGSSAVIGTNDSLYVFTKNGVNTYEIEVLDLKTTCSAKKSVSFSGENLASAIISSTHGTPYVICNGDQIELSGLNSNGGTAVSSSQKYHYKWKEINTSLTTFTPFDTVGKVTLSYIPTSKIDTLVYELKISDKRGCVDSAKTTVIWNTKVKPEIEDSLYSCVPDPISLNLTKLEGGFTPYTYSWSSDKNYPISNANSDVASILLSKSDSTIITLLVKDRFNCQGTVSAMATGILFESKILAHHPKACENFADTLEILPSGDFIGPFTYDWTPDSLLSNPKIFNPIAKISQPTTFFAEIIDTKTGCKSSNSIDVNFYEFQVSIVGDTLLCFEEEQTILTANPIVVGDYPIKYKWISNDLNIQFINQNSNNITVTQLSKVRPVFPTIIVEMYDSIGCKAYDTISTIWNDSIQVQIVNSKPTYIHPITLDEYHFMCLGTTNSLQSSVKNGKTPYQYNWGLKEQVGFELRGVNTDPVNSVFVKNAENKDTLTLKITDALGCTNQTEYSLDARKLNVDLISSKDSLCPKTDFDLTAITNFDFKENLPSSNVSYSFDNRLTYVSSNIKNEVSDIKELFTVFAYDSITTCQAFDSVRVKIEFIKINLVSTFSVVGETNTKICYGDQAFVDASTSKGGQKPYEFIWSKNDTLNVVANVPKTEVFFDSLEIGIDKFVTYYLNVKDQFGCESDTSVIFRMNKKMEAFTNPLNIDTLIGCVGQPVELGSLVDSLVAKGGTGQYTYYWTNHDIPHYDIRPWTKSQGFITKRATTLAPYPILRYTLTVSDKALPHCKAVDVGWAKYVDRPYPNFSGGADTIGSCKVLSEPLIAGVDTIYGQYPSIQWFYNKDTWPTKADSIPAVQGGTRDTLRAVNEGHYIIKVIDKVYNCISYDSSFVNQDSLPGIIIHSDPVVCDNKRLKLWAEFIPEFDPFSSKITWSISNPNSGNNTSLMDSVLYYIPNRTDSIITFKAKFSNFCATNSDSVKLKFLDAPFAGLKASNIYINPQETVSFQNLSKGSDLESNWEIHSALNEVNIYNLTTPPIAILYPEEGIFETKLYIQDTLTKCTDTANVFINVEINRIIYVPNVLSTQAENAENRVIKVYAEGVVEDDFSFSIFNRWGQRIYHTTDFNTAHTLGWDGKNQINGLVEDMGVYTYTLNCKYLDGRKLKKQGTITLIK